VSAEEGPKMITVKEARERLNISRVTMARLVKEGRFTIYDNPLDRREKLIPEAELAEVKRPQPRIMPLPGQASKRAA
jgi:excisionase family DNA binding protein